MSSHNFQNARKGLCESLPRSCDGLASAAAALTEAGLPCTKDMLSRAKKAVPTAFKSSRVYLTEPLLNWLEADSKMPAEEDGETLETKEILERRKLREQYLFAKKRRLVQDEDYTANADIERDMLRIGAATRAALQAIRGAAPQLEGLPAAEIDKFLETAIEKICAELHEETRAIYK